MNHTNAADRAAVLAPTILIVGGGKLGVQQQGPRCGSALLCPRISRG